MAKYCSKCGSELVEGSKFCPKCGQPVQAGMGNHPTQKKGSLEVLLGKLQDANVRKRLGVVLAFLLVICVIGIFATNSKPYEKPLEDLERGINNRNAAAFVGAFHPSAYEEYDLTDADLREEFDDEGLDRIHFEILDAEKLSKEDLEEYEEEYGIVKAGYRMTVDMSITEFGDTETDIVDVDVIKIDGKWYLAESY